MLLMEGMLPLFWGGVDGEGVELRVVTAGSHVIHVHIVVRNSHAGRFFAGVELAMARMYWRWFLAFACLKGRRRFMNVSAASRAHRGGQWMGRFA